MQGTEREGGAGVCGGAGKCLAEAGEGNRTVGLGRARACPAAATGTAKVE